MVGERGYHCKVTVKKYLCATIPCHLFPGRRCQLVVPEPWLRKWTAMFERERYLPLAIEFDYFGLRLAFAIQVLGETEKPVLIVLAPGTQLRPHLVKISDMRHLGLCHGQSCARPVSWFPKYWLKDSRTPITPREIFRFKLQPRQVRWFQKSWFHELVPTKTLRQLSRGLISLPLCMEIAGCSSRGMPPNGQLHIGPMHRYIADPWRADDGGLTFLA